MSQTITKFRGLHGFLSNFHPCDVFFEGRTYPSAENAYQAAKLPDGPGREPFVSCGAGDAKRLGRRVAIDPTWDARKLDVMERVVWAKFSQNEELAAWLLATGDRPLVEGNHWGDTFWGVCDGKGSNHLGKILERTRAKLLGIE